MLAGNVQHFEQIKSGVFWGRKEEQEWWVRDLHVEHCTDDSTVLAIAGRHVAH